METLRTAVLPSRGAVTDVVSSVLGEEFMGDRMRLPGLDIYVDDNPYRRADLAGDFLDWPGAIEVVGHAGLGGAVMVDVTRRILEGLWGAGIGAVAAADFEDELPFRGGIGRPV
jgi:hypothetical protein